jgi:succinoglycan biosynthesis transport protein ExoP
MARSDFPDPQLMNPPVDGRSGAIVPAGAQGALAPSAASSGYRMPEIITGGFNQTWLVNCLRRRWLLATLMGLLMAAATAAMLMWLFPETSRVTSYLEVEAQDTNPFDEDQRMQSPQEIARQAAAHLALIRSPMVLQKALESPKVRDLVAAQNHEGEEVLWLLDELKVSFAVDSPILEVRYEGDEKPDEMKIIIDAVVQSYKDNVLLTDATTQSTTREALATVLAQVKEELERKLEELRNMADVEGSAANPEFEMAQLERDINLYQTQLIRIGQDLVNIDVLKELALNSARSQGALDSAVTATVDADPTLALYQEQLFAIQQQMQALQGASRNGQSAQLRQLQSAYAQTEAQMDGYRQAAEKAARERLEKIPNEELRAAIAEYQVRYDALMKEKADTEEKLQTARDRVEELAVGNPEVAMLQAEIESKQELVSTLDLRIQEWIVMKQQELITRKPGEEIEYGKVRVVQKAVATEEINKYERWAIAGIGGLGALALTCYTVALIEFRRRRLNGPNDVEEGLGIRVLGVLPRTTLKQLSGNSLVAAQVAEAIDSVRAAIMHDSTKRARQVVLVTSPATMEGSTTVAASLALSLARAGRRTLLVDGDVRAPALHRLFGMAQDDGLCEVLRSEIDLADAIHPTSSEGLYLLTAGVCDMDAIYALATDQPQAIFEKLRDQFDFIVIDAPPVLGISDALSLGNYVDGAVLTVLRDHSEIRRIHQASEALRSMGVRLIGCVVNGMPVKADRRVVRLHQAGSRQPRLTTAQVDEAPEA